MRGAGGWKGEKEGYRRPLSPLFLLRPPLMIKHFPDFHPQQLEGERFLQQWHVRFQDAVMGNTIGGMSGHVEHP